MKRGRTGWKWWACQVLAWLFGGVFVWSGWLKVQDPGLFLVSIRTFRLLPDPYAAWLALALPWLELFAGFAVLTGWLRRGGLLLLNASLAVFAAVLSIAWARGLNVDCGCFGAGGETTIVEGLVRDAVLLGIGLFLWFAGRPAAR